MWAALPSKPGDSSAWDEDRLCLDRSSPSLCSLVYKVANVTPAFLGTRKHRNKTLKLKILDLPWCFLKGGPWFLDRKRLSLSGFPAPQDFSCFLFMCLPREELRSILGLHAAIKTQLGA